MRPATTPTQSLPSITVGEDTVILISDHLAHVTSKSRPGMLHSVTDFRCSCIGFYHRSHCRHVSAVVAARLHVEYADYLAFAASVNWTPMPYAEWYEQRDHDADEPAVEASEPEMIWAGNDYGWLKAEDLPKSRPALWDR